MGLVAVLRPQTEAELAVALAILEAHDIETFVHGRYFGSLWPGLQIESYNTRTMLRKTRAQRRELVRSLLASMMLWTATNSFAVDFVDPEDMGPDAPDMLVPESVFTSCSKNELGISLNLPIADKRGFDTPTVTEHPLTGQALNVAPSCQHGSYLVEATLTSLPPGETGMCAATHSVRLRLHVNKKLVLNSFFANYCNGWGITSVKVINRSVQDELGDLVACGYWNIPSELFEKGGSVRSYRCDKYPLDKMYEKSLLFVDGTVQ